MYPGAILWVDVETTGLNPNVHKLLEIGAAVTTYPGFDLCAVTFQRVIHRDEVDLADMDDAVREMHTRSGLLDEVRASSRDEWETWREFCRWAEFALAPFEKVYLGGRTVHFDRRWMESRNRAMFSRALKNVSHRHYDLSAIKLHMHAAGHEVSADEDVHRALPDVMADIALARALVRRATL